MGNPGNAEQAPRGFARRGVLVIIRLQEVVAWVKALLGEWEKGEASGAVEAARPCPRCGRFRHPHGRYIRFVVVGGRALEISIPRLFCPACRRTDGVLPWFLAPRSPYPWLLRQAAVVSFLVEEGGYRAAAARYDLDWQLLWAWLALNSQRAQSGTLVP